MGLLVLAVGVELVFKIVPGAETADEVVGHEATIVVVKAMKLDTTGIATKPGLVADAVVGAADA